MKMTAIGLLVPGPIQIGGESTGWQILLDNPILLHGQALASIEVDHDSSRFPPYANKRVEATGELGSLWGPERGLRPVLEVETIRELV